MSKEQEVTISQAMEIAIHCHKAGKLQKAVDIYRQILRIKPELAEVHGNLGSALKQQGKLEEAALCYRNALALRPDFAEMHFNLGNVLFIQDRLAEAETCYREAITLKPDFAPLYNNLGNTLEAQDRFEEAELCYRQAISLVPDYAELHYNLGNVLRVQKKLDEAAVYYRSTLKLQPDFVGAHTYLGNILKARSQFAEATLCYRRAVKLKPNFAQAYNSLGTVLQAQNLLEEAILYFRHALSLKPDFAEVYNNLGQIMFIQNRLDEALICSRYALVLKPRLAAAYNNLGHVLEALSEIAEAENYYRRALIYKPKLACTYNNLAEVLRLQGKVKAARLTWQAVSKLNHYPLAYRINRALLLPIIMQSSAHLVASRHRIEKKLAYLLQKDLHIADPWQAGLRNNLYFAFPNVVDRPLRNQLATFYRRTCPSLLYTAPHCQASFKRTDHSPLKIGFVLNLWDTHSLGHYLCKTIISHLSRDLFSVHLFCLSTVTHETNETFQASSNSCETLPVDLELARQHLAQQQLDILFYPEIGPEPFLYFLAFARLAPVQCAYWGDVVTTGLPNLDYLLTIGNEVAEKAVENDGHRLIRLDNLFSCYDQRLLPTLLKDRQAFGLADLHHLYLCPQSLFQFHPDFDFILAAILERDSQGQVILLEGPQSHWTNLLKKRFLQTMPKVIDRVQFLPRPSVTDYLNLMALADVVLDTCYWEGNMTTYDALAMGTPIVTLCQAHLHTTSVTQAYVCYTEMGWMDCVASSQQEYIEIALRLGTESVYREQVKARILAHTQPLDNKDRKPLWKLEQSLVEMTREVKRGFSP